MCLMKFLPLFFLFILKLLAAVSSSNDSFIFYGLAEIKGVSEVRTNGLFNLTNGSVSVNQVLYYLPLRFKNSSSPTANVYSFTSSFVFAIVPNGQYPRGYAMAFVITPSDNFSQVFTSQNLKNDFVALEIDTFRNIEVGDIDDNHIGIDISNNLTSLKAESAAYVDSKTGKKETIDLASGRPIQCWVEYDGLRHQLNVTLAPIHKARPTVALLSLDIDLSTIFSEEMYVGFTTSTGQLISSQYVLGWSFKVNGEAEDLDASKLPSLPSTKKSKKKQIVLAVVLSITGVIVLAAVITAVVLFVRRRKKAAFTEVYEDWEAEFGPHRFAFKDLALATRGFDENQLLGQGGFGKVFKGELPISKEQIAVKRIFQKSDQGMKEFVAEIGTLGRVRHPNLARLLGYCRGKDEFLLVYDYMPNGSLDKFLHNQAGLVLSWNQRYNIIKDVALALAYLHEGWVEVIVHRDIKASNVLLDGEFNAKLGDFGLARCSTHSQDPKTTLVAGTFGYMAPELVKTGKASTRTDVYAFGAFCLEVACGRRPINLSAPSTEEEHLVDWVFKCWKGGDILKTTDSKLGNDFDVGEIDLVLKVGLLCSHNVSTLRPRMSEVVLYLSGQAPLPENLDAILHQKTEFVEELSDYSPSSSKDSTKALFTSTRSLLSSGR